MNCPQAERLIQTALDGPLAPDERRCLDTHTARCAACHAAWEEYRHLDRTFTAWARRPLFTEDPGDAFTAQVMSRIARGAASAPRHRFPVRYWGPAGAGALLALSYWTGPIVLSRLPPVPVAGAALPGLDAVSLDGLGRTLRVSCQDTRSVWETLTTHTTTLHGWAPEALAVMLGLNCALAWLARHPHRRAIAR